jgi:hypothetical protein
MTRTRTRTPEQRHSEPSPVQQPEKPWMRAVASYHIIDRHLHQARQSNLQAQRLQAQGLHDDAQAQNRMTQVFIHNALCRIQNPRPGA